MSWRVLAVCLAAGVTTLVDQSVLTIALPSMRDSLSAGDTDVQWIISGYSLTFGLALVPGGSLGDARGRRGLFLLGLAVFLVCAVVAATGAGAGTVIAARLVQGAGAGLVNSQVIGTIQDVFHGVERTRALGMYAVVAGVSGALGPALGGALVWLAGPTTGWRWCLLLSVPFGLVTLWFAARRLPRSTRTTPGRLDGWGLLCVGALTVSLMMPFITGTHIAAWVATAVGSTGALVVLHRRRVRQGKAPLIHPALTRSAPYILGTAVAMAQFGSAMAAGLVLVLFLQSGLGMSALTAAAVTLPSAVAMVAASAIAWRVVRRIGAHAVSLGTAVGIVTLLVGAILVATLPVAVLPVALAVVQLAWGAANGLALSPNQARVLQHAPAEAAGVAGGILQMAQQVAAAVCLSAVSGVYLRSGTAEGAFVAASVVCAGLLGGALVVCVVLARWEGRVRVG
ncbi:putative arabinose efflux permease, MFS family [Actinokineospora diospyrosa]|uniref:Arabinose efflux permease, MFS family n=1 Tax=Actinokineospora diospyrosa TaxID=103728 RepID=A0ABT1IBF9_9PSEU|nr:putative arabinose efflux permease, MFS family [Actinokineospora diospyrosa]